MGLEVEVLEVVRKQYLCSFSYFAWCSLCLADIVITLDIQRLLFCHFTLYMLAFNTLLEVTVKGTLELVLRCPLSVKVFIAYI